MTSRRMPFWYRLGFLISSWFFRCYMGLTVTGRDLLPEGGGYLLASNHISNLDPPAVGVAVQDRDIYFLAKSTLFRIPVFGWLIRRFNSLPILRGEGPRQDWEQYLSVLRRGGILLVFPEGTRSPDGTLQRGKSGFARLAHLAKVPVYPVYVQGTYEAAPRHGGFKRHPVHVTFGSEVPLADLFAQPEDKRVLRRLSERVMEAIAGLAASAAPRQETEKA